MVTTIEGVTNMNCCGGIEPGIHYSETDTEPPRYVRRCFQSSADGGSTNYDWSGFPCTGQSSSKCCGGKGTCVASSGGGYCEGDTGNFVYNRRSRKRTPYMKRRGDNILNVNNVDDMEQYFYNTSYRPGGSRWQTTLTPEMQRFMYRMGKNQGYVSSELTKSSIELEKAKQASRNEVATQTQNRQITYWITFIHVLLIVAVSITIKEAVIAKIQGFLNMLYMQYLNFSGKALLPVKPS
jgi:hypothetical protein